MSPEVIGLLGAVVGAVAGLGGGLTVQAMQAKAQRKQRIGLLGAQLAAASYLVSHAVRRAIDDGQSNVTLREFIDLQAFQDGMMAASELAIIAPDDVADKATDLANAMSRTPKRASKVTTTEEWNQLFGEIRDQRKEFIVSMRDSKLRLVARAGAIAVATSAVTGIAR